MKGNKLGRLAIVDEKPEDPLEQLLGLACACGNIVTEVVNVSKTGKMHPNAAFDMEKQSPIAINQAPPKYILAGVIIPIQLANELLSVAAGIVKDRELAGNGRSGSH